MERARWEGNQQFGVKRGYMHLELCGSPWYSGQLSMSNQDEITKTQL